MSSFAEEKVKKYIRSNLSKFHRIRVAQMIRLPCLTDTDRQEISAYLSTHGNNLAVWEFFERLQSREDWLQVLMEALREDNLGDLADDLQRVYNMYQPRSALSSPVVRNIPPSRESSASGFSLPNSAEQNPSAPSNLQSSREAQSSAHLPPESPRFASLTRKPDLPEISGYYPPVQETDLPSQNSEIVAEPKVRHSATNLDSPPSPKNIAASPFNPGMATEKEKPSNSQAPSATSGSPAVLIQDHLGEMLGTPAPAPSRSDFSNVAPKWGDPQLRPVYVKSGYFGNMSRMAGNTGASPTPLAHLGPKTSGNQPVEDHYSSSDNFPAAAPKRQDDLQKEKDPGEWRTQVPWGYQKKRTLGDPVEADSRATFNVRRPWGVEQGARNQLRNSPVVTDKNVGETSGAAPALSRTRNSWERGFSSTDVIPPDSHTELSTASSRGDLEDLKSPVQEEKWPVGQLDDLHASALVQETCKNYHSETDSSIKVSVTQPRDIVDESTVNSTTRRNGSSQNNRVFYTNPDDDGPCKPGVLTSGLGASFLGQLQSGQETDPEYSGRSDRLRVSSEFSLNGDPLMLSDPSQNGQPEEKSSGSTTGTVLGKPGMGEGDNASFQDMNDNQDVSGSIRTFKFRVEEDASINLAAAPNTIGYQELQPNHSPGAFPHSATRHQSSTPTDSHPEDSHQKERIDETPPWIPSDYALLLVGFVLASVAAIAFALYKKK